MQEAQLGLLLVYRAIFLIVAYPQKARETLRIPRGAAEYLFCLPCAIFCAPGQKTWRRIELGSLWNYSNIAHCGLPGAICSRAGYCNIKASRAALRLRRGICLPYRSLLLS